MAKTGKDFEPLVAAALEQGWRWEMRSKHGRLYSPDGKTIVAIPTSPSDHRGVKNKRAELKRAGVKGI